MPAVVVAAVPVDGDKLQQCLSRISTASKTFACHDCRTTSVARTILMGWQTVVDHQDTHTGDDATVKREIVELQPLGSGQARSLKVFYPQSKTSVVVQQSVVMLLPVGVVERAAFGTEVEVDVDLESSNDVGGRISLRLKLQCTNVVPKYHHETVLWSWAVQCCSKWLLLTRRGEDCELKAKYCCWCWRNDVIQESMQGCGYL